MCFGRVRGYYHYLDDRFTDFSIYVDEKVNERTLLDIPLAFWRWFKFLVYVHFWIAIFLFVYGVLCFCLGVQYSFYYTEVNCGDGLNVWPPAINLIASVFGMVTLRTLHIRWSAFIHLILLVTSLPFVIATIISSSLAVERWEKQPLITAPPVLRPPTINPLPTSSFPDDYIDEGTHYAKIPQWKNAFIGIDGGLALLSVLNLITIIILLVFYGVWWVRRANTPGMDA
ncbi:unnamed protein product [Auanema sp. JU1783]|nr:unnamed protein product [Auanema sp. JU1783]